MSISWQMPGRGLICYRIFIAANQIKVFAITCKYDSINHINIIILTQTILSVK